MLFYGDEAGYINDYSYKSDTAKSYDNRWMHRPIIDWSKNEKVDEPGTVENRIFSGTKKLIQVRKSSRAFADLKNLTWVATYNDHVAAYLRTLDDEKIYCLFNFSSEPADISWSVFRQHGPMSGDLEECISGTHFQPLSAAESLALPAYSVFVMKET